MNALGRKAIEVRLIHELQTLRADAKPNMREIRLAIAAELGGCSPAELAGAVQSLRYQGKMQWDRLALSPSMLAGQEPASETAVAPTAAEGGAAAASITSPPSILAGPDDEDDYPGEVNDEAEQGAPGKRPLSPESQARDGADLLRPDEPALPQRRVEEPRPGPEGDQPARAERERTADQDRCAAVPPPVAAPYRHYQQPAPVHRANVPGGWTKASRMAGAKPLPAPAHEPEIARQIREECDEAADRRRRARSTGTIRQPLELRKFGLGDLSLAEGLASMVAEDPHDLMVAVSRKHPALWRRVLLLGRAAGKRPGEALYAALECGLDQMEAAGPQGEELRNVA